MTLALAAADRERVAAIGALEARLPAGVEDLVGYLDDRSWPVRRLAVAALARAGDVAVGPLTAVLRDARDDEGRIAAAVDALSASTGARAELAVIALGEAGPAPVTADAAQILGRRRSTAGVPTLERWVGHEDDNVSVAAMEALGRIGGGAGLDAVIRAASSGKFFRAYPAVDLLARSGDPRAVPPLEALLDDPLVGPEAARGLARIGDVGTASVLARRLARGGALMTRLAARSLVDVVDSLGARFGTDDGALAAVRAGLPEHAAAALGRALQGADPDERVAMARVLGWVATSESAALLVGLLTEGGAVATAAAEALSDLGALAHGALMATLQSGPSEPRRLLLPLLGAGLRDDDAVAACLRDPEPDVRALACATAARTTCTAAVPRLFELLGDSDPKVAQAALSAIQALGHSATEPLTLQAARSSSLQVRRAALRLLGAFGWPPGSSLSWRPRRATIRASPTPRSRASRSSTNPARPKRCSSSSAGATHAFARRRPARSATSRRRPRSWRRSRPRSATRLRGCATTPRRPSAGCAPTIASSASPRCCAIPSVTSASRPSRRSRICPTRPA